MPENDICPLCSKVLNAPIRSSQKWDAEYYDCPQCGKYFLDRSTKHDSRFNDSRYLISAWIRRQHKLGIVVPIVASEYTGPEAGIFDSIQIGYPTTVNEKLDSLLRTYESIAKDDYGKIIKIQSYPEIIPDIAAKNEAEILGLNEYLEQLGYIWSDPSHPHRHIKLTANGWFRISELNKSVFSLNSAFIAMWYDTSTEKYRQAVVSAVKHCGYNPLIIDSVDFNDFIMDEVINLIRQSRFVVVDLTSKPEIDDKSKSKILQGVRGGVYWESGLAYGMGKPVIQTCKSDDDSRRRIHFDLDQYQTIFWNDSELDVSIRDLSIPIPDPNFAEKLAQRILVTVGRGNYYSTP